MPPPPPHGTYVNHYPNPKTGVAGSATPRRTNSNHNVTGNSSSGNSSGSNSSNNAANNTVATPSSVLAPPAEKHLNAMGPATSQR